MKAKAIQICGTGSGVGKSIITAALCRILRQDGFSVAPFKAQNMALNSCVTKDGGEIGRAQAVQAQAAGIEPTVDMNPILIKPSADRKAQIVLLGKPVKDMSVYDYVAYKKKVRKVVVDSYQRLAEHFDVVVIEGAGSPAEINLKEHDIVNMAMAEQANASVILVGDIDKGGVFAWLVGTLELLTSGERARVKGFIINKFRGDKRLLQSGITWLEKKTGIKVLGVIPYFRNIKVAEEDAVPLERYSSYRPLLSEPKRVIDVAVIALPHLSNFTDFDPFERESDVRLRYVYEFASLGTPDVLILPGTKNTLLDMKYLKRIGMLKAIKSLFSANPQMHMVGICGGYQMLGMEVRDEKGVESREKVVQGFGLLPVVTVFGKEKTLTQVVAREALTGMVVRGYEIHHGQTHKIGKCSSVFQVTERMGRKVSYADGAMSVDGKIWGTYLHGVFDADEYRRDFLNRVRKGKGVKPLAASAVNDSEKEFDKLASLVRRNIRMNDVYRILEIKP